jgi:hypothetical protein
VTTYKTTWRYNPQNHNPNFHHSENFKPGVPSMSLSLLLEQLRFSDIFPKFLVIAFGSSFCYFIYKHIHYFLGAAVAQSV